MTPTKWKKDAVSININFFYSVPLVFMALLSFLKKISLIIIFLIVCLSLFYHRVVLVENIPDDISFLENGTSHVPLSVGLYSLLDRAVRVVEIVSPLWLLNSSDYESSFQPAARQVKQRQ